MTTFHMIETYAPPRSQDETYAQRKKQNSWDVHDDAWWRLERQILGQEFTDITMQIILAGADAGMEMLPPGLDVLIDWDVFNQAALDWSRRYLGMEPGIIGRVDRGAYNWVHGLTESTRRTVINEIDNWVREGAALPVLEARLVPTFGSARASRIAATEVTRVYASGNQMAWEASGIVNGKRWQTANDDRVCPICGPLHNTLVDLSGGWNFTPEMLQNNPELARALREPQTIQRPPAHVNCRCWIQPVIYEALDPDEIERDRFG